jgi:ssDNA-binding Zn-finger/Zn-ribbon topoisomerase 1
VVTSLSPSEQSWTPSPLGELFTGTTQWKLSLARNTYLLQMAQKSRSGNVSELEKLQVAAGLFWPGLSLVAPTGRCALTGFPTHRLRNSWQLKDAIHGPYGSFVGCSTFPRCPYTRNVTRAADRPHQRRARRRQRQSVHERVSP